MDPHGNLLSFSPVTHTLPHRVCKHSELPRAAGAQGPCASRAGLCSSAGRFMNGLSAALPWPPERPSVPAPAGQSGLRAIQYLRLLFLFIFTGASHAASAPVLLPEAVAWTLLSAGRERRRGSAVPRLA